MLVSGPMSKSVLIIHNPVAGRRWRARVDRLFELLAERGFNAHIELTAKRGDAREAARRVDGVDIIVAAGGDGTVNEVVDGLAARASGQPMPAVAFLPLGTANVLAWELSLPRDPDGLVRLIEAGTTVGARPGIANGSRFVLMTSVGLDARAVAAVTPRIKRLLGGGAYVLAAIAALQAPAPTYSIAIDGRALTARTVIVTRARRYGGPFRLAPAGGLETPEFQVVLMKSYGWRAALRYGVALALGRLHRLPDVEIVAGRTVTIDGPANEPVQIDGDLATHLPLKAEMDSLIVPFVAPVAAK